MSRSDRGQTQNINTDFAVSRIIQQGEADSAHYPDLHPFASKLRTYQVHGFQSRAHMRNEPWGPNALNQLHTEMYIPTLPAYCSTASENRSKEGGATLSLRFFLVQNALGPGRIRQVGGSLLADRALSLTGIVLAKVRKFPFV
ncbi:hypothetical protein CSKR_201218 [Clonorchis sinensis]|uniref:Uncharacterized protein n=1 Tax=Clonorchis sinensis TaxID=79923 RepID=A0A8T1MN07_CLOSI|nr:hypothetical protein CSKR_201218 [Clonorchis sinensis]